MKTFWARGGFAQIRIQCFITFRNLGIYLPKEQQQCRKEKKQYFMKFKLCLFLLLCSYNSTTGIFTVPPGGDGVYYFSTYMLVYPGESARFDMRLNGDVICTIYPDHDSSGANDFAPGSSSAVVRVVAGIIIPLIVTDSMRMCFTEVKCPRQLKTINLVKH